MNLIISEFNKACVQGKLVEAQKIYTSNPSVASQTKDILNTVCRKGHIDIFKWLIQIMNYNELNQLGLINSILKTACGHGHLEIIQLLLCMNPYADLSHGSWIFFSVSSTYGHVHVIKYLLECCIGSFDQETIDDLKLDLADIAEENGCVELSKYLNLNLDDQTQQINWSNGQIVCSYDSVENFIEEFQTPQWFKFACVSCADKIINTWAPTLSTIEAFESALYTLHYSPKQIKLLSTGLNTNWIQVANQFVFNGFKWGSNKMIQLAYSYGFVELYPNPYQLIELLAQNKCISTRDVISKLFETHPKLASQEFYEPNSRLLVKSIYETNEELCKTLCELIEDLHKSIDWSQFVDLVHISFFLKNIHQTRTNEGFKNIINEICSQKNSLDEIKILQIQKLEKDYQIQVNKAIECIFDDEHDINKLKILIKIKTTTNKLIEKSSLIDVLKMSNYVLTKFILNYKIDSMDSSIKDIVNHPDAIGLTKRILGLGSIDQEDKDLIADILFEASVAKRNFDVFDLVVGYIKSPFDHLMSSNPEFVLEYLKSKPSFDSNLAKKIFNICCSCRWHSEYSWNQQHKSNFYGKIINLILDTCNYITPEEICHGIASLYINKIHYLEKVFPSIEQIYIRVFGLLKESDICNLIIKVSYHANYSTSQSIYTHIIEQTGFNIRFNQDYVFKYAKINNYTLASYLTKQYPNFYRQVGYNIFKIIKEEIKEMQVDEIGLCPICLDTKCNTITDCSHQFCSSCIALYDNPKCPICRQWIESYYSIKVK